MNGGLWTAADPGMLQEGQLSAARNLIYLPGSQAVNRAPGRTEFGVATAVATSVQGLRDIQFDNGDQYLIAHTSSNYVSAQVVGTAVTGTPGALATGIGQGLQLEVVQYRNRFFLMNGTTAAASAIGSNRVVYLSATGAGSAPQVRQHGMLPVESGPTVTTAGGGSFSQSVTGYYEYWTTEVAKLTQDGSELNLESTFVGQSTTVFVTATSVVPTITMPQPRNAITTHWRIYRSPKKDVQSDKLFPTGFSIAEISTATAQQADSGATNNTGAIAPSLTNTGTTFFDTWTNPGNVFAAGSATVIPGALGTKGQGYYGFNFGGFKGAVRGIEVVITGIVSVGSPPMGIYARIGKNRNPSGDFVSGNEPEVIKGTVRDTVYKTNTAVKSGLITSTNAGAPTVLTLGGPTDRWFPADQIGLVDSDFSSSGFMVVLYAAFSTATLAIDSMTVKVYYGGVFDSVIQFPTVVYTFGDISAQVGKNGPPPSSTTGDVYEDSLVVNDVSNTSVVRYSYPGDPESFPQTYYLDFETRENDQVRAIKVVNDRVVVWLDSSAWRLNYLPSERDASFDRGKAKQAITRSYGCVNPMCVAVYTPTGDREFAAFVSDQGICHTDGFNFQFLTGMIDWRGIISTTQTSTPIALINDRERQQLLFYFRNDALAPESYLCMALCYDDDHLVNGMPKVAGLTHMRNSIGGNTAELNSAWAAPRAAGDVSVFLGYGGNNAPAGAGRIYIENGTVIPAADPRMTFSSRLMYLGDFGSEWKMGEVYGYAFGYGATTPSLSYAVSGTKTNDTGLSARGSKTLTLGGQKLHKVGPLQAAVEGAQIHFAATASAYSQEFLIIDGTGYDIEDSGR